MEYIYFVFESMPKFMPINERKSYCVIGYMKAVSAVIDKTEQEFLELSLQMRFFNLRANLSYIRHCIKPFSLPIAEKKICCVLVYSKQRINCIWYFKKKIDQIKYML